MSGAECLKTENLVAQPPGLREWGALARLGWRRPRLCGPKLISGVHSRNMVRNTFLYLVLAVCALPAITQCCPEKPQAVKRQLLWQKLQEELHGVDRQLDGVLALAVKDLTSGEEFFINPDEIMPQASSIKIAVLAELYRQAQQGKLKLIDEYVVRKAYLVPGTDIMPGLTPRGTRLTVPDLATTMVAQSEEIAPNSTI